jgi:hypothetical protein
MPQHHERGSAPRISVLMPTYNQVPFIRRALASLRAQTIHEWELVVVVDGATDETGAVLAAYAGEPWLRLYHNAPNAGLGAALNQATRLARGHYLAYLPSDDLYLPHHLEQLAALLDARPEIDLAYGGVRWGARSEAPTLRGAGAVGHEAETLAELVAVTREEAIPSGNLLALVQVMHRRTWEAELPWPERAEIVSDTLEADHWRALLARGARFAYSGAVSCEWVSHPEQRHQLIAGHHGGLARYRRHYGVGGDVLLNWQPSRGMVVDERERYRPLLARKAAMAAPREGGLTILLVGELGFNPERIMAFEERGHRLLGTWVARPETWDATGPLPGCAIEDIPFDQHWAERVRASRPDVIYALLNWQSLELIDQVQAAAPDIPLVFHFKEGPFICLEHGLWPLLMRVLARSDGVVLINQECSDWFQAATDGMLDPQAVLLLDGDLPKRDWMTDDWAPKLSDADGALHTVCAGRPLGLDPFAAIAAAGIHVHFYGRHFQQAFPRWTSVGVATGFMHLHDAVEPQHWVRELSRYDAAWFHVFTSDNGGDLGRARWDDLNLPARLGTYAAAGLPWIMKDNRGSRVALQQLAERHGVGVFFDDFAHLGEQLRDHAGLRRRAEAMRASRMTFSFDAHVDDLIGFFERTIARHAAGGSPSTSKAKWGFRGGKSPPLAPPR